MTENPTADDPTEDSTTTARSAIVVVGSANMDLVVRVPRIPASGETVLGTDFVTLPGGKGANQAVAAARLGADVSFLGKLGKDPFANAVLKSLQSAGVKTDLVRRTKEAATGVALIGVDEAGSNAIMVAPGANGQMLPADINRVCGRIYDSFAILLQMEIPASTIFHAINFAKAFGVKVILNPAPISCPEVWRTFILELVDVLIPNEHEAAQLMDIDADENTNWPEVAQRLRKLGPACVIITLGAAGCVVADEAGVRSFPAVPTVAVDTTAAGDCFIGAFAASLAEGSRIDESVAFAQRAAAISVTRLGAQQSMPTRAEVEASLVA